jgi:hypothetical protein
VIFPESPAQKASSENERLLLGLSDDSVAIEACLEPDICGKCRNAEQIYWVLPVFAALILYFCVIGGIHYIGFRPSLIF